MNYLIIDSHPYAGSFARTVSKSIGEILSQKGNCKTIDLVANGFDPVMRAKDLCLWGKGQTADPLVKSYQKAIEQADLLVFLFPTWWGGLPAVLKGFCDKVLLPNWAYTTGFAGRLKGKLKGKRAVVISTMRTPGAVFRLYFHNPVKNAFVRDTLSACGVKVQKYMQIGNISGMSRARTAVHVEKILRYFHGL